MKNYSIKLLQDALTDLRRTRSHMIIMLSKEDLKAINETERIIEKDISLLQASRIHFNQKLTRKDIILINSLKRDHKLSNVQISKLFNVTDMTIGNVVKKKGAYAA